MKVRSFTSIFEEKRSRSVYYSLEAIFLTRNFDFWITPKKFFQNCFFSKSDGGNRFHGRIHPEIMYDKCKKSLFRVTWGTVARINYLMLVNNNNNIGIVTIYDFGLFFCVQSIGIIRFTKKLDWMIENW